MDYEYIATLLENSRIQRGDVVSFDATRFDEIVYLAVATEALDSSICPDDQVSIVRDAIRAAGQSRVITGASLKREVRKAQQAFASKPVAQYVLATTILVRPPVGRLVLRERGATLTMTPHLPPAFKEARASLSQGNSALYDVAGSTAIRVRVNARTISEARSTASNALYFVRGCWNLSINKSVWYQFVGDDGKPLNEILQGPMRTVHSLSGVLATSTYSYDRGFEAPRIMPNIDHRWKAVQSDFAVIRRSASNTELGRTLRYSIIRYCGALDSSDPAYAFLQLWGILEKLMPDNESGQHRKIVDRTCALYSDGAAEHRTIDALRMWRNDIAHSGALHSSGREMLVLLNRYVVSWLLFLVRAVRKFETRAEMMRFLDMPSSVAELRRSLALCRQALKYRAEPAAQAGQPAQTLGEEGAVGAHS